MVCAIDVSWVFLFSDPPELPWASFATFLILGGLTFRIVTSKCPVISDRFAELLSLRNHENECQTFFRLRHPLQQTHKRLVT